MPRESMGIIISPLRNSFGISQRNCGNQNLHRVYFCDWFKQVNCSWKGNYHDSVIVTKKHLQETFWIFICTAFPTLSMRTARQAFEIVIQETITGPSTAKSHQNPS